MLKNEDYHFQNLLKVKIEFPKYLKNEDLKIPDNIVKEIKTTLCAGSPNLWYVLFKFILECIGYLCILTCIVSGYFFTGLYAEAPM